MTTPRKTVNLKEWLELASLEQRRQLYAAAGTSRASVHQLLTGWRTLRPAKAAQLEEATRTLNAEFPELPIVLRTSTCETCAACPFAIKCLGNPSELPERDHHLDA